MEQTIPAADHARKGYPGRAEAERILAEAEPLNPGPWGDHSRTAAHCAEKTALYAGLDPDKAYVLGLLHDIGRRFGKRHLGHVSDGYTYMMSLGYGDAARICLTHSFNDKRMESYVEGVMDIIDRMGDVKRRYGFYDPDKWNRNLELKAYFEEKMGKDLYEAVEKDTFTPGAG